MNKMIRMSAAFVALVCLTAVQDPDCNKQIKDNQQNCTTAQFCSDYKYKDGCATRIEVPGALMFYACKGGGTDNDDCVVDPMQTKCSDVYQCINPAPPLEDDKPCVKGNALLDGQGDPVVRYTTGVAITRSCVVPKKS